MERKNARAHLQPGDRGIAYLEALPAQQRLISHQSVPYIWLGLRDAVILVVVLGLLVFTIT